MAREIIRAPSPANHTTVVTTKAVPPVTRTDAGTTRAPSPSTRKNASTTRAPSPSTRTNTSTTRVPSPANRTDTTSTRSSSTTTQKNAVITKAPSPTNRINRTTTRAPSPSTRTNASTTRAPSPASRTDTTSTRSSSTTARINAVTRRTSPAISSQRIDHKKEFEKKLEEIQSSHLLERRANEIERLELKRALENKEVEIQLLSREIDDLKRTLRMKDEELVKIDNEKRKLLNDLVDAKGQIRVVVRTRPTLEDETTSCEHLSYPAPDQLFLDAGTKYKYKFQKVFGPNFSQKRIFEDVEEFILSVLHGYNTSIIAYGQTGSGKTFTMRGGDNDDLLGIIPRSVNCIFANQNRLKDIGWTFTFTASYVEIYNDEVYDLLDNRKKIMLKKGTLDSVDELARIPIETQESIKQILRKADRFRSVTATRCNEESSRSHAIFELRIEGTNYIMNQGVTSVLHLVDLAGSERAKESGAEGTAFKEMTYINASLSNLQMCIRAQLEKSPHVPYRNSKLTRLLSNSLGAGSSKTLVIVTLNPSLSQVGETKRSLDFANEMQNTKIGAAMKNDL